jgi:hypothetical protein
LVADVGKMGGYTVQRARALLIDAWQAWDGVVGGAGLLCDSANPCNRCRSRERSSVARGR